MIVLPAPYAAWRRRLSGPSAQPWLDALPLLAAELADDWGLELLDVPPRYGAVNLALAVRRDKEPAVLRLCWPQHPLAAEVLALRAWGGRGAVRLLAVDLPRGAVLLERLDADRDLTALPLAEAATIAGRLIRQLAIAAPSGVSSLRETGVAIAVDLPLRQAALSRPVPAAYLDRAVGLATDLAAGAGDRLVHADLHYGNVLWAPARDAWAAIDPRATAGDPEYAVPELMWTRADDCADAPALRRLLAILVAAGDLDHERAGGWAFVRAVDYWLWGLAHGLTEDPPRCARVAEALSG